MSTDEIYNKVTEWAGEFDTDFAAHLTADPEYSKKIFSIGRGGKKPRKDFATLTEVKPFISFFFDDYFKITDEIPDNFDKSDVKAALEGFAETYDYSDDMNTWFSKIGSIGEKLGYTTDMKAYKADPSAYKGNVGDISMFIRVAVTGRLNSPDLYTVMQIIGKDRTLARVNRMAETL